MNLPRFTRQNKATIDADLEFVRKCCLAAQRCLEVGTKERVDRRAITTALENATRGLSGALSNTRGYGL